MEWLKGKNKGPERKVLQQTSTNSRDGTANATSGKSAGNNAKARQTAAGSRGSSAPRTSSPAEASLEDDSIQQVWVPDRQDVWKLATLETDVRGEINVTVNVPGTAEPVSLPRDETRVWDPSHSMYLEDAATLNNLHEPALLNLLRQRFTADDIYTYTGDVLISLNPYKPIPFLYDMPELLPSLKKTINKRISSVGVRTGQDKSNEEGDDDDDDEEEEEEGNEGPRREGGCDMLKHPHVYSVADKAHQLMIDPNPALSLGGGPGFNTQHLRNQSIIITGESGAGKTEAAKHVMRYLIEASRAVSGTADEGSIGEVIQARLVQSTVVLEAFGNAKTVRNDNSSRFGKYIKLQYDDTWQLVGATTLHFLLEKSRLVHQDPLERNYHIFYQLCRGSKNSPDLSESLHLRPDPSHYRMLKMGGVFEQSEDIDDADEFQNCRDALSTLGLSEEEKSNVWRVLAALLHMGNADFRDAKEGTEEDPARAHLQLPDGPRVEDIAELLSVKPELLIQSIVTRVTLSGRGSMFVIPLDKAQSRENVEALIKHVYGQLFSWLVGKINDSHSSAGAAGGSQATQTRTAFTGILDIFGFEIMNRNSFEQLCINFANEVLQQQFNQHIFVREQEEYAAEGLSWDLIHFQDNQPVIDLISKKPTGLLIQLEEQAMLGRKADNSRLLVLYHQTHLKTHPCYSKPRFESPEFIVKHFAGEVTYDVAGMLEKNNDSLHDNLLGMLEMSGDPFVLELATYKNDAEELHLLEATRAMEDQNQSSRSTLLGRTDSFGRSLAHTRGSMSGGSGSFSGKMSLNRHEERSQREGKGAKGQVRKIAQKVTVSHNFRRQLDALMCTLRTTQPHYIKCIKPNSIKAPGGFSPHMVRDQLLYSGVLEVVRIRQEAYPVRMPFQELLRRFPRLHERLQAAQAGGAKHVKQAKLSEDEAKKAAGRLLAKHADAALFQLGRTQAFIKEEGVEALRLSARMIVSDSATVVQAWWRAYLGKKRFACLKAAAVTLQRVARGHAQRRALAKQRASAQTIQRVWRGQRLRRLHEGHNVSASVVQKMFRGYAARKLGVRRQESAVKIQSQVRRSQAQKRVNLDVLKRQREEKRLREEKEERERQEALERELREREEALKREQKAREDALAREQREKEEALERERKEKERALERERALALERKLALELEQKEKELALERQRKEREEALEREERERKLALEREEKEKEEALKAARELAEREQKEREEALERERKEREKALKAAREMEEAAVCVQSTWRGRKEAKSVANKRRTMDQERSAASMLSHNIRYWLRGLILEQRVADAFHYAAEGNVNAVAAAIKAMPELLYIRNRYDNFKLLIHAACGSGSCPLVSLLDPLPSEMLLRDSDGNTAMHFAAASCNYDLVKLIAARHNAVVLTDEEAAVESLRTNTRVNARVGAAAAAVGEARDKWNNRNMMSATGTLASTMHSHMGSTMHSNMGSSMGGGMMGGSRMNLTLNSTGTFHGRLGLHQTPSSPSLRGGRETTVLSGFLMKRRETGAWQRRWCVLTPDSFMYFHSKQDHVRCKKAALKLDMHMALLKKTGMSADEAAAKAASALSGSGVHDPFQSPQAYVQSQQGFFANQRPSMAGGSRRGDREDGLEHCFELHSPQLLRSKKNKEGRLYFRAESEEVMYTWLRKLRAVVANHNMSRGGGAGARQYLNVADRKRLVRTTNKFGETPLHWTAKTLPRPVKRSSSKAGGRGSGAVGGGIGSARSSTEAKAIARVKISAWLVEAGCPVDARDRRGDTVLHLTARDGTVVHAASLVRKGGDLSKKNKEGCSAIDYIEEAEDVELMTVGYYKAAERRPLLPPPRGMLSGLTYVRIMPEKLMQQSTADLSNPFITVTVYDPRAERVEIPQDILGPAMVQQTYTWWSSTWHMQNPLENLGPGCVVIFELKDQDPETGCVTPVGWAVMNLDPETLDSREVNMEMFLPPTDTSLQKMVPADLFFTGDLALVKGDETFR